MDNTFNIKDINTEFTKLFRDFYLTYSKISGNELFGKMQAHQLSVSDGVSIEYDQGKISFKNSIDQLQFLIDHRSEIAETLNVTKQEIFTNRRNTKFINECLAKIASRFELGNQDETMQLFISKTDDNIGRLSSTNNWADYILTQDWISKFTSATLNSSSQLSGDQRIDYLAQLVKDAMTEHNQSYHEGLVSFNHRKYVDYADPEQTFYKTTVENGKKITSVDGSRFTDAYNKFNSFRKLTYGFYEIFKPIGGTMEKYIKIKLFTNGKLDIQGVVGLEDCTEVPWEYGSQEYLRSLNTGNKRYELKLSIPFNDENSTLWWKPDEKELIEPEEDENPSYSTATEEKTEQYRYYKPYETERFLRWFGSNYVPMFDLDYIYKKTICSEPKLKTDVQPNNFFSDATNLISNPNFAKANQDNSTSTSLLSMAQKSTIQILNKDDGQYLRFIVGGYQQTSNLSFHITGQMLNSIQELNHYGNTFTFINELYVFLTKQILFLELTRTMHTALDSIWSEEYPTEEYIPNEWIDIRTTLESIVWNPNQIDLIRLRTIDFESVMTWLKIEMKQRITFLNPPTNKPWTYNNAPINLYEENLYNYIKDYSDDDPKGNGFSKIDLPTPVKEQIMTTLSYLSQSRYDVSYETTVDEIRERIETLNNLIVRLPDDNHINRITSNHIFKDWKMYVDESLKYLVNHNELFTSIGEGVGTDGLTYTFTEYYTDANRQIPLIDYSYCVDENGNIIHDRWDYWTEEDFVYDED